MIADARRHRRGHELARPAVDRVWCPDRAPSNADVFQTEPRPGREHSRRTHGGYRSVDVIVGVVRGIAIGALVTWVALHRIQRRGSGSSHRFATGRWKVPLARSPAQMPPAELEQLLHSVNQLGGIDASALHAVIGVGASSIVGDLTVELIAIEIREAGCRGILRFRFSGGEPEVTVTDDRGTPYETGLASWSGSANGGQAEFHFAPRPPADAHQLTIVIERFRESRFPPELRHGPAEGTPGPWEFPVEIEPPARSP